MLHVSASVNPSQKIAKLILIYGCWCLLLGAIKDSWVMQDYIGPLSLSLLNGLIIIPAFDLVSSCLQHVMQPEVQMTVAGLFIGTTLPFLLVLIFALRDFAVIFHSSKPAISVPPVGNAHQTMAPKLVIAVGIAFILVLDSYFPIMQAWMYVVPQTSCGIIGNNIYRAAANNLIFLSVFWLCLKLLRTRNT